MSFCTVQIQINQYVNFLNIIEKSKRQELCKSIEMRDTFNYVSFRIKLILITLTNLNHLYEIIKINLENY